MFSTSNGWTGFALLLETTFLMLLDNFKERRLMMSWSSFFIFLRSWANWMAAFLPPNALPFSSVTERGSWRLWCLWWKPYSIDPYFRLLRLPLFSPWCKIQSAKIVELAIIIKMHKARRSWLTLGLDRGCLSLHFLLNSAIGVLISSEILVNFDLKLMFRNSQKNNQLQDVPTSFR